MNDFVRGRLAENKFATSHLKDFVVATQDQDMFEHWDVEGIFAKISSRPLKFDVKALKKINRHDELFDDKIAWIEGTNVRGNPGWIKGQSDYIVFEREHTWMIVNRHSLHEWIVGKLQENSFEKGKGLYQVYTREGRKDKITLIKYSDIPEGICFFALK